MPDTPLVRPDWQLPTGVHAFVTTRHGGFSKAPYASFNLGHHVGDDANAVARNRELLNSELAQQCNDAALQLQWIQQVHGIDVQRIDDVIATPPVADASYTTQSGIALGVLTADCLPVLYCSHDGNEIAVAHAGWRGLCNGVLEATLAQFKCAPSRVRCWLGPAIGPCHFEVGEEVRDAFLQQASPNDREATLSAFKPGLNAGKWMGDLYVLARLRLQAAGVADVAGQVQCTVCLADKYYSYRHQNPTGRFATVIARASS
ncbi:MAG: peptidoglycan editing factor PgeF [Pseudomonadota bacterium]